MIVVPVSNSIGWLNENLYVKVIREVGDVPGSYPFTVCIRNLAGVLVLSRSFTYDFTREEQTYAVDVSSLGEGEYRVYIYNWNNCNPPPGTAVYEYWMHKIGSTHLGSAYLSFEGWDYSRMYVLLMYTLGGKLYWQHGINTSDFVVPLGARVYIEATDRSGNAFVGVIDVSGDMSVRPNTRIPFMATFRFKYDRPVSERIARVVNRLVWMMKDVYINVVDDNTVELVIVKTEPGLTPTVAVAVVVVVGIVGGVIWGWLWYDARIREIEVEHKRIEHSKPVVDVFVKTHGAFLEMLRMCGPGDSECISRVYSIWVPQLQLIGSVLGALLARGYSLGPCDGLRVGGVCVPWWVVGVAVFLAGLLVIAVVRR